MFYLIVTGGNFAGDVDSYETLHEILEVITQANFNPNQCRVVEGKELEVEVRIKHDICRHQES